MGLEIGSHAPEDLLERYAMRRMSEAESEALEDHLMFCQQCQEALNAVDVFLLSARQASRLVKQEDAAKEVRASFWLRFTRFVGISPEQIWKPASWQVMPAAAIVMAGLPLILMIPQPQTGNYQQVPLQATRGADAGAVTSSELLELQLDLTGLHASAPFRVEIASAGGATILSTKVQPARDSATVRLPSKLAPGQYWVRVHAAASDEILREYSLRSK